MLYYCFILFDMWIFVRHTNTVIIRVNTVKYSLRDLLPDQLKSDIIHILKAENFMEISL